MAAGTTPVFVATPKSWYARASTANTERVFSTGNVQALVTGAANGSAVEVVKITATETTTAGMVRFWLSLDGGTTKRLVDEIAVSAITASASVPAWKGEWVPTGPFLLPDTNAILYVSTEKGEGFNFTATGGDY